MLCSQSKFHCRFRIKPVSTAPLRFLSQAWCVQQPHLGYEGFMGQWWALCMNINSIWEVAQAYLRWPWPYANKGCRPCIGKMFSLKDMLFAIKHLWPLQRAMLISFMVGDQNSQNSYEFIKILLSLKYTWPNNMDIEHIMSWVKS